MPTKPYIADRDVASAQELCNRVFYGVAFECLIWL